GDEHAFGDELAYDVGSAGTEGEARGDFTPTPGKSRQQQVGDVRAGDQQHAADCAEEQQIALTLRTHGVVEQRHDLDLGRGVDVRGMRRAVALGDDVHGLTRLLERHARPQSCNHLEEVAAVVQL